jgi:hypothetical protein
MTQVVRSCNAILCIRNLPVKHFASIVSYEIETTCPYCKSNSCQSRFPVNPNATPIDKSNLRPPEVVEKIVYRTRWMKEPNARAV